MRMAIALSSLLLASPVLAGAEQELRAIEETRRAAIAAQDFRALSQIYAESFLAVAGNGAVIDRDRLFDAFRGNDPSLAFATDEVRIVEHGDTAVFFGRLVARAKDGRVVFANRFTHTFVREGERWRCIAGQATPLDPAAIGSD